MLLIRWVDEKNKIRSWIATKLFCYLWERLEKYIRIDCIGWNWSLFGINLVK